jgi:hypothetical protein
VRAELESIGFTVLEAEVVDGPRALADAARTRGAIAAVRVTSSARGVEVWVVDRVTGKTLLREIVRGESNDVDAIAVRAVELLRASLLELETPNRPAGEVPAPPPARKLIAPAEGARARAPTRHWFDVAIGPSVIASPGGIGPQGALAVAARLRLTPELAFGTWWLLPAFAGHVDTAAASAELRTVIGGVGFELETAASRPWSASVGAGFGFTYLGADGRANAPLIGAHVEWIGAGWFGRVGGAYNIDGRMRVRLDVSVGSTFIVPVLTVGDVELGRWGQPWIAPTCSLELAWP